MGMVVGEWGCWGGVEREGGGGRAHCQGVTDCFGSDSF